MRYEHIELDLSTAACAELERLLGPLSAQGDELDNLRNELRARLQRRDVDPHAKQPEGWLET